MKTFFTSDTHFGHANIIKYCSRPFADSDAMDAAMIGHWNNVVGRRDLVYHLGDFAYNRNFDSRDFDRVFNQLNGKIIFIKGNHDKLAWGNRQKFHESYDSYHEAVVDGQTVILCHYAMRTWKGSHRGTFHLYGHSHGTLPDDPDSRSFDCGVDCHSFSPISFDRVKEIMATKNFKPVDHHGK